MKILFIGGTGNISLSASQRLLSQNHELWLLNRSGQCNDLSNAHYIKGDITKLTDKAQQQLVNHEWDVVVNWVAFNEEDAQRDIELFSQRTKQYVFISSASCYLNPGPTQVITEKTPLDNPFWQYSRDKISAEQCLMAAFEKAGFPVTIVRPSHTYSTVIPLTLGGWKEFTTVARMQAGKPIVVQDDGTAVWTVTHADDFATGICGLLGNGGAIGEDFHITTNEVLSWNEIYQLTAAAVGCEANIVHVSSAKICQLNPDYRGTLLGDKSVTAIFDNSKIKALVPEFKATIAYAEGIKRTIAWFQEEDSRQVINTRTDAFIDTLIALS